MRLYSALEGGKNRWFSLQSLQRSIRLPEGNKKGRRLTLGLLVRIIHQDTIALHPRAVSLHKVQLSYRFAGGSTLDQRIRTHLGGEQKEVAQEEQMEKDHPFWVPSLIMMIVNDNHFLILSCSLLMMFVALSIERLSYNLRDVDFMPEYLLTLWFISLSLRWLSTKSGYWTFYLDWSSKEASSLTTFCSSARFSFIAGFALQAIFCSIDSNSMKMWS